MRRRLTVFRRAFWLDGLIGGLAVASLAAAFVFQAVLKSVGGSPAAVATNLAYPLADAVLIALVVLAVGAAGWRLRREWILVGLGLAVFLVGDSVYLIQTSQGTYVAGNLPDASWLVDLLLVAYAAAVVQTGARQQVAGDRGIVIAMPIFFIVAMVGLEAWDHVHRVNTLAIVLTSLTLLTAAVRLALTLAENLSMLRQSHASRPGSGSPTRPSATFTQPPPSTTSGKSRSPMRSWRRAPDWTPPSSPSSASTG
jgi:hypothetical protein